MNCPELQSWDLLAMEALEPPQSDVLRQHAAACGDCHARLSAARRAHIERLRAYEAFDREHEQRREQLMAALPEAPPHGAPGFLRRLGEQLMNTGPTTRRTAAILLPAACIALFAFLFLNNGHPSAFAAALERIRTAQTIVARFEAYMNHAEVPMQTGRLWLSEADGMRVDVESHAGLLPGMAEAAKMSMVHKPGAPIVILQPALNVALRMHTQDGQLHGWSGGLDQSSPAKFLEALRRLTGDPDQHLGRSEIDGRDVEGFELSAAKLGLEPLGDRRLRDPQIPPARARLWVDVKSSLPVRMEVEMTVEAGPLGPMQVRAAYSGFEFDVALDRALFELAIPNDVRVLDVNVPAPTEETFIELLRFTAETLGEYPAELDPSRLTAELILATAAKRGQMNVKDPAELMRQELIEEAMRISMALAFVQKLRQDGVEIEYFGADVQPEDTDAVLLRWSLPAGGQRVIYGDLRAETIEPLSR